MREAGKTVGPAGLQRSFERSVKSDDDEVVASACEAARRSRPVTSDSRTSPVSMCSTSGAASSSRE